MQIVESFGKNVFVGKQMIGYIDREGIFINRQKFADITPDGEISYNGQKIGYVDEDGYIIIKGKEVGYVDNEHPRYFFKGQRHTHRTCLRRMRIHRTLPSNPSRS